MSVIFKDDIPLEVLKDRLIYNETNGIFTWKRDVGTRGKKGTKAGSVRSGYLVIKINRVARHAHRIAWVMYYGQWPKNEIDHIDGNKLNNAISNLREVTTRENCQNRGKHRKGKLVGIHWCNTSNRWVSKILNHEKANKSEYLGCFKEKDQAYEVYVARHLELYGCYPLNHIEKGKN